VGAKVIGSPSVKLCVLWLPADRLWTQGPGVLSICAGSEVSPDSVGRAQAFGIMRLPNTPDHDGGQDPVGEHQPPVGPATAARRCGWPWPRCGAPWCAAVHGSASSSGVAGLCDEGDTPALHASAVSRPRSGPLRRLIVAWG
jgi:hypothetical protein